MDCPEPQGWPTDARRDRLIGDWYLYQRTGGHRTSTDDLITAWYAIHRHPERPECYLDLGCGTGSVMFMVSHKLRPALVHGIEAQAQSAAMAERAIGELPEHQCRFQIIRGDFRELPIAEQRYELITGSPPYFPVTAGLLPKDAQRRACRFELRGGVEGYMQAAARALTPDGRFYVVFQSLWQERVLEAASQHGLHLTGQADFWMRRDRPAAFLSVYELSRHAVDVPHRVSYPVRDSNGEISPEYLQLRRELGVSAETASPGPAGTR